MCRFGSRKSQETSGQSKIAKTNAGCLMCSFITVVAGLLSGSWVPEWSIRPRDGLHVGSALHICSLKTALLLCPQGISYLLITSGMIHREEGRSNFKQKLNVSHRASISFTLTRVKPLVRAV